MGPLTFGNAQCRTGVLKLKTDGTAPQFNRCILAMCLLAPFSEDPCLLLMEKSLAVKWLLHATVEHVTQKKGLINGDEQSYPQLTIFRKYIKRSILQDSYHSFLCTWVRSNDREQGYLRHRYYKYTSRYS